MNYAQNHLYTLSLLPYKANVSGKFVSHSPSVVLEYRF